DRALLPVIDQLEICLRESSHGSVVAAEDRDRNFDVRDGDFFLEGSLGEQGRAREQEDEEQVAHDWANRTPVACFARTGPERRTQSAERKSKKDARNASMGGCASHFYILRSAFCVPGRCTKSTFKRDRFNHPPTPPSLPLQHPMPQNPRDLPHRRIGLFSEV